MLTKFPQTPAVAQTPALSPPPIPPQPQRSTSAFTAHTQTQSLPSSPKISSSLNPHASRSTLGRPGPGLGATRVPSTSFNTSAFTLDSSPSPSTAPRPTMASAPSTGFMQPTFSALAPSHSAPQGPSFNAAPAGPNYNITLPPAQPMQPMQPMQPTTSASPPPPFFASQMSMGGMLAPSKPAQPQWPGSTGGPKQLSKDDWGDFDPLA